MVENFSAVITASIKEFQSKMKEVDAQVRDTATEATKPIGADITDFFAKIRTVEQLSDMISQPLEKVIQAEVAQFNKQIADLQAKISDLESEIVRIRVETRYESPGYEKSRDQYRQYFRGVSEETRKMQDEMKAAFAAQREAIRSANEDMIKAEYGYFKMAEGAKNFTGTNREFMDSVKIAGAAHKAATDAMMKNNELLKMSLIETAGTMLNMSTQASKISDNYTRMQNPLLMINKGGLAAADGLNKLANAGNASVLALKMLGPTANMKELNDMTRMITQGMMRFQMVAMGAAITSFFFYGALHKAAMGNETYAKSFNTMLSTVREALQPMVDVFSAVMTRLYDFITAIAQMVIKFNEAHPTLARLIQGVMMLVPALTLLLSPLAVGIGLFGGLAAAWASLWPLIGPLVTGLAAMSTTVWIVAAAVVGLVAGITYLWKTNEGFRTAITTAWNNIKTVLTAAMTALSAAFSSSWAAIKDSFEPVLQSLMNLFNALKPALTAVGIILLGAFAVAWTNSISLLTAVVAAIGPLVAAFMNLVSVVVNVVASIVAILTGDFDAAYQYWNAATQASIDFFKNLWASVTTFITTFASTFVSIITAMADAASVSISGMVSNIVSFFQSLWKSCVKIAKSKGDRVKSEFEALKRAAINAWNAMKSGITSAMNAIKNSVTSAWNALKSSVTSVVNGIKSTVTSAWNATKSAITSTMNSIKSTVTSAWNSIKSSVTSAMNSIKSGITSAWNAIKSAITSAMHAIKSAVTSGFNALKSTVTSAMNGVVSAIKSGWNSAVSFLKSINLSGIGRNIIQGLVNGIKSGAGAVGAAIQSIAGNIKSRIQSALGIHSPSRWMRDMIGENIVAGIVVGIHSQERSAVSAMSIMAASITDAFTPNLAIADVGISRTSLDAGLQMDEIKQQIKDELDVDLWVHQRAQEQVSQSSGGSGDVVLQVDGYELARVQRSHLDGLNGTQLNLTQFQRGQR